MCGPLVMMIGKHRFRHLYFAGRLVAFSFAGLIAGEIGAVANVVLAKFHLSALLSLTIGTLMLISGFSLIQGSSSPILMPARGGWISRKAAFISSRISLLMLRDAPLSTFIFGLLTIALPCGQSLVVFSACALAADPLVGFINGLAFALLTSPSLFIAMRAHAFLPHLAARYNIYMGMATITVALLALFRGFAELELIPHLAIPIPMAHPFVLY